jgi:prevent-host-death family protein
MKRTISAMEARKRFGELLEDVSRGDEVVIERAGKPMGVVVPISRYDALERRREAFFATMAENAEKNRGAPDDELSREIKEAIREARDELRSR